jgi:hypothetical protein
MSMALLTGFIVAYPINWWLVAKGLKHGMMTVRPRASVQEAPPATMRHDHDVGREPPSSSTEIVGTAATSAAVFGLAIWLALALANNR